MYCTWKNKKCKNSRTKISTLKNRLTVEVSKAEKRSDLKVIDASSARFARACKAICIARFCIEFRSKEMRFDLDE